MKGVLGCIFDTSIWRRRRKRDRKRWTLSYFVRNLEMILEWITE